MMHETRTVIVARDFLTQLVSYRPGALLGTLALMVARSLTDGLTLLLLIPLLSAARVAPALGGDQGRIFELSQQVFGGTPSLVLVLAIYFMAIAGRSILACASTIASAEFVSGYAEDVRCRLCNALCNASWLHLATSRQARDTHALTMQAESVEAAARTALGLFGTLLTILSGLTVAFLVSPWLALATCLAALALAIPFVVYFRLAFLRGAEARRAMEQLYEILVERMSIIKLAKAFSIERALAAEVSRLSTGYRKAIVAVRTSAAYASLLQEIGAAVVLVLFVYLCVRVFNAGSAELIILVIVFSRILPPVMSFQSGMRSLVGLFPEYRALQQAQARAEASGEDPPQRRERIDLARAISLRSVGFSYPEATSRPALEEITVELPARKAIGLVGLSGAGKSTLADIIAGLVAPTQGAMLVDGRHIDESARANWRASVTYVPQDAPLFHDSLRSNLTMGASPVSESEIWSCLEAVKAADLVRQLPSGLDTQAGDRGVRFSGGERQRLRLASALLRKPQLLLLDESTSALNPIDERQVLGALRERLAGMTIIMIAHRLSSIAWTDMVVVLDKGRIAEIGEPGRVLSSWTGYEVG